MTSISGISRIFNEEVAKHRHMQVNEKYKNNGKKCCFVMSSNIVNFEKRFFFF